MFRHNPNLQLERDQPDKGSQGIPPIYSTSQESSEQDRILKDTEPSEEGVISVTSDVIYPEDINSLTDCNSPVMRQQTPFKLQITN